MVESAAEHFDPSIYGPPITAVPPSTMQTSVPLPVTNAPLVNLRAGGYELSVGGAGGSGLFRTGTGDAGASFQVGQIPQVAEGLRDGAGKLWGSVRQRVEDRVSRSGTPQAR